MKFNVLVAMILLTGPAWGLSGKELLAECEKPLQQGEGSTCLAYIVGFTEGYQDGYMDQGLAVMAGAGNVEGLRLLRKAVPEHSFKFPICMPPVFRYPQLQDVFVQFVRNKPDYLKKSARAILVDAFITAYPCK